MPRMDGSANVIDCISHCHADIVSCLHVPADAIEGAVPGILNDNRLDNAVLPDGVGKLIQLFLVKFLPGLMGIGL